MNNINDDYTAEDGIFITETEIYNKSLKVIENGINNPDILLDEYKKLSFQYRKLLRQTKKLVHMADNTQLQLRKTNDLVQEKVNQLTIAEGKLKKLTITDPLTEILNRRGIFKHLEEQEIRYRRNRKPFSIFIIDADFFKKVNDRYGHNAGDHVLKKLSIIIKENLREQDIVGRWGGEEFILILPDTDNKGAIILAEKVRSIIENSIMRFNDTDICVTISMGGCCYKNDIDLSHCLEMADKALYRSKKDGRNRVNFHGN